MQSGMSKCLNESSQLLRDRCIEMVCVHDRRQPKKYLRTNPPEMNYVPVAQTVRCQEHPHPKREQGHLQEHHRNIDPMKEIRVSDHQHKDGEDEKMREKDNHVRPSHHEHDEQTRERDF